jgi:sarcosine/dimethylglycine N-methyltransferase
VARTQQTKSYYEGTVGPIYRVISGTSLHLGMYESEGEARATANARTKDFLAGRVQAGPDSIVVDLGSGFGDSGRYLAGRFGCRVIGVITPRMCVRGS